MFIIIYIIIAFREFARPTRESAAVNSRFFSTSNAFVKRRKISLASSLNRKKDENHVTGGAQPTWAVRIGNFSFEWEAIDRASSTRRFFQALN